VVGRHWSTAGRSSNDVTWATARSGQTHRAYLISDLGRTDAPHEGRPGDDP